jgi:hypothetical protein
MRNQKGATVQRLGDREAVALTTVILTLGSEPWLQPWLMVTWGWLLNFLGLNSYL